MSTSPYAYAHLQAAVESLDQAKPLKPTKLVHGLEALDTAECQASLEAIQNAMDAELERFSIAESLESLLADQRQAMSPLEADMLAFTAKRIGLTLPHARYGFGMESYSGLRGRTMLRASTEALKDWWHDFIQRIVKLWKRFVGWLKTLFDSRFRELRATRNALRNSFTRAMTRQFSSNTYFNIAVVFGDVNGNLDIRGVCDRTGKFVEALTNGEYLKRFEDFSQKGIATANKSLKLDEESDKAVDELREEAKGLIFPVPQGVFRKGEDGALYSDLLATRQRFKIVMRDDGDVFVEHAPTSRGVALQALKQRDNISRDQASFDAIRKIIDSTINAESRVRPFLKLNDDTVAEIDRMANEADGKPAKGARFAAHVLTKMRLANNVAGRLMNESIGLVVQIARGGYSMANV